MTLEIRPMRWWDIEPIVEIEQDAFGPTAWTPAQFWGELAQPTRAYVVAESADRVVGYAGLFVLAPDADVQTIAVAPGHRGRGTGRRLLDWLMGTARDRGATRMMLEVKSDNDRARTVYRQAGFVDLALRRDYYGPGRDAVIMRAELGHAR